MSLDPTVTLSGISVNPPVAPRRRKRIECTPAPPVQQPDELEMFLDGDLLAAFRVGCGEDRQPASRPAEDGAGALHPGQLFGLLYVVFGPHGAELHGTERLRRQPAYGFVRLLIGAPGGSEWISHVDHHGRQYGIEPGDGLCGEVAGSSVSGTIGRGE